MEPRDAQKRLVRPEGERALATVHRVTPRAVLSADRSFKVLKPSHAPTQLSLFPPGGMVLGTR